MKKLHYIIGILIMAFVGLWPLHANAITVSPGSISLNVTLIAGQSGSYTYALSIQGVADASWNASIVSSTVGLSLDPVEGDLDDATGLGSTTLTITVGTDVGEGTYTGSITFYSDEGGSIESDSVPVHVTVNRVIGDRLVISPASIEAKFISPDMSPQSFPITIRNLDPDFTSFRWSVGSAVLPCISVSPVSGTGPGTVTVTVNPAEIPAVEDLTYTENPIEIIFASDIGEATLYVEISFSQIGNRLVVSPSSLNVKFTRANLSPVEFPINIMNANPNVDEFDWSASSNAAWLEVVPRSGTGTTSATIRIYPNYIPTGVESTAAITFESSLDYLDEDQENKTENVPFTVTALVYGTTELTVSPSYLMWDVEVQEGAGIPGLEPQMLIVSGSADGWGLSYDVSWLNVSVDGSLVSPTPENNITVAPVSSLLNYGWNETNVKISDPGSGFYRLVPIYINVHRPGETSYIPVPPPEFIQNTSAFILIEATDAHLLDLCLGLGNMETGQNAYLVLEAPYTMPGVVYSYTPARPELWSEIANNGIPVPGANGLYYSPGPIPDIKLVGFPLKGITGEMWLKTKVGTTYSSAVDVQSVRVIVLAPAGSWRVTEFYQGVEYTYPDSQPLTITQEETGYSGQWGDTDIDVIYGDGKTCLYKLSFSRSYFDFIYEIKSLSGYKLEGIWKWRWHGRGAYSAGEPFIAERIMQWQ